LTLAADRRDRPAEQTIADVAADLNDALATARILADQLSRAAQHAGHLGLETRTSTSDLPSAEKNGTAR
jgi:hypothetical protein